VQRQSSLAVLLLAGVTLPLLVGLFHYEVRQAMSVGRWPFVIGMLIGFNGLFAMAGAISCVYFTRRKRSGAAWTSIIVATVISATFSASAESLANYSRSLTSEKATQNTALEADKEEQKWREKVSKWNQQNAGKVIFKLEKGGAPILILWPGLEHNKPALTLTGTIENKTEHKVVAVVVDIGLIRSESQQTVHKRRFALSLEVFPTAVYRFDGNFTQYKDDLDLGEFHRAIEQIKPDYQWTYNVVVFIPEVLSFGYNRFSFGAESSLQRDESPVRK
jgi:hypothetical protein